MSMRDLGVRDGMEKAAFMTASVDEAIRKLRGEGMDRAAQGLRVMASPSAPTKERFNSAQAALRGAKKMSERTGSVPGWYTRAMSDALKDDKYLSEHFSRLFKENKMWLQTPGATKVHEPMKPKPAATPTPGSPAKPKPRFHPKQTSGSRYGRQLGGKVKKMPRWGKGLLAGAGLAALGAGVHGMYEGH